MKELIEGAVETAKGFKEQENAKEGVILAARELKESELAQSAQWAAQITPRIFDAQEDQERMGGLSACNYKCITSYCYPPNIAKGIGSASPHAPNSAVGHT